MSSSAVSSATYLVQLVVQDVKPFRGRHVLDLRTPKGKPAPWTLILGENGVGKTSLLECIAATVPRRNVDESGGRRRTFLEAAGVVDGTMIDKLARHGNVEVEIRATYAKNERLAASDRRARTFDVGVHYTRSASAESFDPIEADESRVEEPLVLSYSAGRRMGAGNLEGRSTADAPGLFSEQRDLVDAEELILQLDYAALKRPTQIARRQRDTFLDMLASMLPDVGSRKNFVIRGPSPIGRRQKSGVFVKVPYGEVHIRQLSFGYQTMLGWLADMAWRLFSHYPNSRNPMNEPAIVLVDEVDLHLHPRWQRELPQLLAKHFPAVQFIATAHSPLMAQASINCNLAVVQQTDDTVRIINEPDVVENWRIDQVVTSDLFGLVPWSPDVQAKLAEQGRLAMKSKLTAADKSKLKKLERYAMTLPTGVPRDLENAMDIIRRAADALQRPQA